MKTAWLLVTGLTLLVAIVLGQHDLREQERILQATNDGYFEDELNSASDLLLKDSSNLRAQCPLKKKCKKKKGTCQKKGTCPGKASKGCSPRCSCCLPISAAVLCTNENGTCLKSEDRCEGKIKMFNNSCKDNCVCCILDEPAICPDGFFGIGEQCFKYYDDLRRNYTEAVALCEAENLALAKPDDPESVRQHLAEFYDYGTSTWLGARGAGSYFIWDHYGEQISNSDPLWFNATSGVPGIRVTNEYCLVMLFFLNYTPYFPIQCAAGSNSLCEAV